MEIGRTLDNIISESGYSKTQFAKNLDISKSFLLRVISGEKKMSEAMFETIVSSAMLSSEHKKALRESYYSEVFGKDDFDLMSLFIDSIQGFEKNFKKRESVYIREDAINEFFIDRKAPYVIGSREEFYEMVSYFVNKMLEQESPIFYSNYSFKQKKLDTILYTLFAERNVKKKIEFYHTVDFQQKLTDYEIKALFSTIKWAHTFLNTYSRTSSCTYLFSGLFPYFIITGECVIIFSADCKNAIVFTDVSTVKYYQNNFKKLLAEYSPLIKFYRDETELLQDSKTITQYKFKYSLDGYMCLGPALDYEILDSVSKDLPNREFLIQAVLQHYGMFTYLSGYKTFHTLGALKQFSKDGRLKFISQYYINNFDKKMRVKLIENLLKLFDDENFEFYLLDESKFPFPKYLNFDIFDDVYLFSGLLQDKDGVPDPDLPYEFFLERDIGKYHNIFDNLYTYIINSGFVYDEPFTKRMLKDMILENQLGE